MNQAAEPLTLDNCDREPIHIPGYIQPHGVLFAFDVAGRLAWRSANAVAMLQGPVPDLGELLTTRHFGAYEGIRELIAAAREAPDRDVIPHAVTAEGGGGKFDVLAHRTARGLICEFESRDGAVPPVPGFSFSTHRAMERLKRERNIQGLLSVAVDEVRRMTGFDRVMANRFRHDESGDVVAESVTPELDPFLGRRYPASDIPAQARRLYILNTLRLIADVAAAPVPVHAAPFVTEPLDMSYGILRSVSPVHIEYLTNMGVGASMSVSIVIGGKLWGMLACHHRGARRVAYTDRMACDVLVQVLASNVQGVLSEEYGKRAHLAANLRSKVVEQVLHSSDVVGALALQADALMQGFNAHGLVLAAGSRLEVSPGVTRAAGAALTQWLNQRGASPDGLVHTDELASLIGPMPASLEGWCGLLALPFGNEAPGWLVLLRNEQIESVRWGGKPEKNYATGPLGPRLTPRGSFDLWRETVKGKAVPWDAVELENAQKLLAELLRADSVHAVEIARARQQLMAMLGHDLRDPLQAISLTATLMQRRGDDAQLSGRLHSSSTRMQRLVQQVLDMSRVHSGTLSFDMRPVDLVVLVQQLVSESRAAHPGVQFSLTTPPTLVIQGDGDRIAQVLSNLLGNAARHGGAGDPVRMDVRDGDGFAVLEVRNSAPPIPQETAVNLFQPFKRNAQQSSTNRHGLGLGLYISQQVMLGHGGTLSYSHEAPHVVFIAQFPLSQ